MATRPPHSADFIAEAKEHLAEVCDQLLRLESAAGDALTSAQEKMLRAVHSVKGGAGFFGFRTIETVAHRMESLLESVMEGQVTRDGRLVDVLLAATDRIAAFLDDPDHSDEADAADLLARLDELAQASPPESTAQAAPVVAPSAEVPLTFDLIHCEAVGVSPAELLRRCETLGDIIAGRVASSAADLASWTPDANVSLHVTVRTELTAEECDQRLAIRPKTKVAVPAPLSAPAPEKTESTPSADGGTMRVRVGLADQLMNLAGELVLIRNQSRKYVDSNQALPASVMQRLESVTTEFQDTILETRMQPIGNLFSKFRRLVRDLGRQLGKQIELQVAGAEVELDKTILDAISDPLTHMVRNACDHGIETPEVRLQTGKLVHGTITLSALHLGDQICIAVSDDGRGIDRDAVRRQAIKQRLRTQQELAGLSDSDLLALILLPGFSTATQVSEVSGRGVGMDVVKANLAQLGGSIDIASTPGLGSTLSLQVPLTLAIIPCLLVGAGEVRFAIPQKDLEELAYVDPDQQRVRIERTPDQEVARLRGQLLPLVRLTALLGELSSQANCDAPPSEEPHILAIVKAGVRRFALAVDSVLSSEEVVVKPMHSRLRALAHFSGATILGDGRVALILRTQGIAAAARVRFGDDASQRTATRPLNTLHSNAVLLVRTAQGDVFGAPVAQVRRLAMVRRALFQQLASGTFITIDGIPTRLEPLGGGGRTSNGAELAYVLLPREAGERIGFLVDEVLGTESVDLSRLHPLPEHPFAVGAAVIRGQITPIVELRRRASDATAGESAAMPQRTRILLVDDTLFFRDVIGGYLEAEGFEVLKAEHGRAALEVLAHARVDLMVSDLEMPQLNGWQLAAAVRASTEHAAIPMLALSTLSAEQAEASALASGFNAFQVKLDRESLLETVTQLLQQATAARQEQHAR
jgi:two-component system, chemotaxis family, sensor kinase CheA